MSDPTPIRSYKQIIPKRLKCARCDTLTKLYNAKLIQVECESCKELVRLIEEANAEDESMEPKRKAVQNQLSIAWNGMYKDYYVQNSNVLGLNGYLCQYFYIEVDNVRLSPVANEFILYSRCSNCQLFQQVGFHSYTHEEYKDLDTEHFECYHCQNDEFRYSGPL